MAISRILQRPSGRPTGTGPCFVYLIRVKTATLALSAWLFAFSSPVAVAPSLTLSLGNDLEYNLDLDEALTRFRQAVESQPEDPASLRAVAGTYLLKIAFSRGVFTVDDFLGDATADTVRVPKPPGELTSPFRENAQRALAAAERQVRSHPQDPDAHYQLGTTIGLLASYSATVDGQLFGAIKFAHRAYKESSTALMLEPRRKDAGLIIGMYQYVVSTRSFPVRWLARVAGLGSNRSRGIEMIEAAGRYPGEDQTDAQLALLLIYNRERRYDDALSMLAELRAHYPRNRLLWLESGATALRAGHFDQAERFLDEGISRLAADGRPRAFGEEALWHYKRGAARARLNRAVEARSDLSAALTGQSRDWVRGRAHFELGRLADLAGDRKAAVGEYRAAVRLAKADEDAIGLTEAERWLDSSSN
jgi:tetratricopeptide (TPR) repeat protein